MSDNVVPLHRVDDQVLKCVDCGTDVVRVVSTNTDPPRCMICATYPGWQDDPVMSKIVASFFYE